MPRTTGVFVKRRAKRAKKTRRRKATRKLTNRKLKDIVSRKKRDTMCSWSPHNNATLPVPLGPRGLEFQHRPSTTDNPHFNLWCASFRHCSANQLDSTRTARSIYMKGLSDTYRVEIRNAPWEWRRIVFASQVRFIGDNSQSATHLPDQSFADRTAANCRVVGQGVNPGQPSITIEGTTGGIDPFDIIFAGTRGIDWTSYFTAPTDKGTIRVLSDKKFRIASGNESGAAKIKKFYTPVNKMLHYDDDESGTEQQTNGWISQSAKLGNIYVLDMFWNEAGQDTSFADMVWNAESVMYWHEA